MHPSGAIGAALEVVAVDVVKGRAGNAAGGGIGADVEGTWGAVAAWLVCGLIMMLSVWFSFRVVNHHTTVFATWNSYFHGWMDGVDLQPPV